MNTILTRLRLVVLAIGSVVALGIASSAMSLALATSPDTLAPDPLLPEYAAMGQVTIDASTSTSAAPIISGEEAAATAQGEVGGRPVASIHHGSAATYVNSPVRGVWAVSFVGVPTPRLGPDPMNSTIGPSIDTTVLVDDSTGEVMRTFSIGP